MIPKPHVGATLLNYYSYLDTKELKRESISVTLRVYILRGLKSRISSLTVSQYKPRYYTGT